MEHLPLPNTLETQADRFCSLGSAIQNVSKSLKDLQRSEV